MHRGSGVASLLVVGLCSALAWAAGPVDLNLRLAPSMPWKVRQTLEIQFGGAGGMALSEGPAETGAVVFEVQYVDRSSSDKGFKRTWVERSYSQARARAGKGKPEVITLEGSVLKFEKIEEGIQLDVLKGKPSSATVDLLRAGPADPVQLLLPPQPVKAGDTWEIPAETVDLFQKLCSVGLTEARGEALKAVMDETTGLAAPGLKVTARVKTAAATEAVIEYSAGDAARTGSAEKTGETPAPALAGTLRFQVKEGRPIALDWQVAMGTASKPRPGAAAAATAGEPGSAGRWTLSRRYEPGK